MQHAGGIVLIRVDDAAAQTARVGQQVGGGPMIVSGQRLARQPDMCVEPGHPGRPGRIGGGKVHRCGQVIGPQGVVRDKGGDGPRAADHRRHPPARRRGVPAGPLDLGQPGVGGVAGHGMDEPPPRLRRPGRPGELALGQYPQRAGDLLGGPFVDHRQRLGWKPRAEHRRRAQHRLGHRVEIVDAGGQHRLHPGGKSRLRQGALEDPTRPLPIGCLGRLVQHSAVDQQVEQLHQEEGVAMHPGEQIGPAAGLQLHPAEMILQQAAGGLEAQRLQGDAMDVGQLGEPWTRPVQQHKQNRSGQRRGQPAHRVAELAGRPFQIVDHDQDGPGGRERAEEQGDRVHRRVDGPLFGLRDVRGPGRRIPRSRRGGDGGPPVERNAEQQQQSVGDAGWQPGTAVRMRQPRHSSPDAVGHPVEGVAVGHPARVANDVDQGRQPVAVTVPDRPSPEHRRAGGPLRPTGEFDGQPGLADPGLPGDQRHLG